MRLTGDAAANAAADVCDADDDVDDDNDDTGADDDDDCKQASMEKRQIKAKTNANMLEKQNSPELLRTWYKAYSIRRGQP